jgi:outer membrane immunogenic protein
MRRALSVLVGAGLIAAGPAFAADLAVEAPVYKAPPLAPVYHWTGFYIGGDIGGFGARQSATTTAFPAGFGAPAIVGAGFPGIGILPTSHGLNSGGVLGGGHLGYNWQTAPNWLIGIEGDVMAIHRSATDTETTFDTFAGQRPDGNMTVSTKNDYLASVRGRLGWVGGPWMIYATGGAAWTNTSSTATWTPTPGALVPAPSTSSTGFDGTKTGFVVGGGVEWMFSPNWLLRVEYLHYGFNGATGTLPFVVPVGNGCTPVGTCGWNATSSNLQFDTARVGLSYKF